MWTVAPDPFLTDTRVQTLDDVLASLPSVRLPSDVAVEATARLSKEN
jgi:hypothetical protein